MELHQFHQWRNQWEIKWQQSRREPLKIKKESLEIGQLTKVTFDELKNMPMNFSKYKT